MDEQEVIDLLKNAGFEVRNLGGGRYAVISPDTSIPAQYFDSWEDMRDEYLSVSLVTTPSSTGGTPPTGTNRWVQVGDNWVWFDVTGKPTMRIAIPQETSSKPSVRAFSTWQEAEEYIAANNMWGVEPYWDEKSQAYKIRKPPTEEAPFSPQVRVEPTTGTIMVETSPNKWVTAGKVEAGVPPDWSPSLYVEPTTGVIMVELSPGKWSTAGKYTPPEAEAAPLESPEFWIDPRTGQKFVRRSVGGAWESFNEYVPSLNQQIDRALAQGTPESVALAQSLKNFRDQPTPAEALRLGMEIMQSPGDWWTYMKLSRGTQPNVPYDVSGQAIPRNIPALSFGQTGLTSMPAQGGISSLTEPTFEYPQPRPEDVAMQAELRKWALNPPATTNIPQPEGENIGRFYVTSDVTGEKQYITDEEAQRYKALGLPIGQDTSILRPPTLPAAGHETELPIGFPAPSMRERISAYNASLKPPGYQYHPINEQEGYETIYGVPTDPSRRAGYIAPSTSLARSLASPTGANGVTSALQTPKFLSELSAGRNVGRARSMSSLGFPSFPSAQGYQNLTTPEQEILQAEVKTQGGYWPQYAREMQELWPTWNKRGAFMRRPERIGV